MQALRNAFATLVCGEAVEAVSSRRCEGYTDPLQRRNVMKAGPHCPALRALRRCGVVALPSPIDPFQRRQPTVNEGAAAGEAEAPGAAGCIGRCARHVAAPVASATPDRVRLAAFDANAAIDFDETPVCHVIPLALDRYALVPASIPASYPTSYRPFATRGRPPLRPLTRLAVALRFDFAEPPLRPSADAQNESQCPP